MAHRWESSGQQGLSFPQPSSTGPQPSRVWHFPHSGKEGEVEERGGKVRERDNCEYTNNNNHLFSLFPKVKLCHTQEGKE